MTTRTRTARFGALLAGAALLAACGEEGPVGPEDELTSAEAAAVTEFLTGRAFEESFGTGGAGNAAVAPAGAAAEPRPYEIDVDATAPCPEGGSLTVSGLIEGTVDPDTEEGTLTLGIATVASACAFPAEGTVFTVDTNPELRMDGDFAWQGGEPVGEQTFSYTGSFEWSSEDGRAGSCTFDLQLVRSEDGTVTETGSACGAALEGA